MTELSILLGEIEMDLDWVLVCFLLLYQNTTYWLIYKEEVLQEENARSRKHLVRTLLLFINIVEGNM